MGGRKGPYGRDMRRVIKNWKETSEYRETWEGQQENSGRRPFLLKKGDRCSVLNKRFCLKSPKEERK